MAPVVVTAERILALKDLADAASLVRRVARLDRLLLNLSALHGSELDARGDEIDVLDEMLGNVVSVQRWLSVKFNVLRFAVFMSDIPVGADTQARGRGMLILVELGL